jgi:putative transposase
MSRNFYSEINLHFVWHTKLSMPLLTSPVETFVHRYLRGKLIALPGAYIHEIGGTENHVHIAVSVFPTIQISELVGQLKGAAAHEANRAFGHGNKILEWQTGYGVVSFGTANLPWVIGYIRHQREHHAAGTIYERLELIEPLPEIPAAVSAQPDETPAATTKAPPTTPHKPH